MLDNLEKIEVEDKNVIWPCDTKIITAKTIETLFKYFDITPGEDLNLMNKKLHE